MSETLTEQEKKAELPEELSDVLLLLDDEKKKIKIVKGMGKDGEPETVDPKQENSNQFLRVDKHGDVFSNFFSNFVSQIKNPTRFRFFRIHAPDAEKVAKYLENHLRNPTPESEAVMKQYEVSRGQKENKEQQKQSNMETNQQVNTEQAVSGTETAQDTRPAMQTPASEPIPEKKPLDETQSEGRADRHKYKPEDVDWTLLNKIGLGKEQLQEMKVLDQLLRGMKTNKLIHVNFNLEGVPISFDARISFQTNANNQVVPAFHGIRRAPNLDFPYFGHTFSEADKKQLQTDGNMGRVVDLTSPRTGEIIPSLVSIDKLTNQIVAQPKAWVRIPDEMSNIKLTAQQKEDLSNGKQLHLKGMVSQKGNTFDAKLQYNAEKKYVEYLFDEKPKLSADQVTQIERREAPKVYRGKEFTDKQHESLKDGKTLFIRDFKDGEGKKYSGYITYNKEKGVTDFSFNDPRKVKNQAATAEESKTQKAVNSDGKTNEATKNIREPLQQGQTAPKNEKQQQRMQQPLKPAKSQGRKM